MESIVKLYGTENNQTILIELGRRIQDTRIAASLTQKELAERAGISLSTLVRLESGESIRFEYVLNVLRALNLLANIDLLVQEQEMVPSDFIDYGKKRKRVRSSPKEEMDHDSWKWGDEE